jgi:glycosyltransferase involved in cell wall biosynthesis
MSPTDEIPVGRTEPARSWVQRLPVFLYQAAKWRVRWLARFFYNAAEWRIRWLYRGVRRLSTFFYNAAYWRLRWLKRRLPDLPIIGHTLRAILSAVRGTLWLGRAVVGRLTLANSRSHARSYWPGIDGLDLWVAALWLACERFHRTWLWMWCAEAPLIRRWRRPNRNGDGVLHVTCSFDLGGTQTQIRNLCTAPPAATRLRHEAVEIFPEMNFLYRQNEPVRSSTYGGPGIWARTVGRLIEHSGTRSSQLVQVLKLVRDFRAAKPQVVVGWGHEISMLTFVAAAIARVPHVVFCIRTFNPSYGWVETWMGNLMKVAHRRMLPQLSGVIVNSTALKGDYAAWLGIDPGVIAVCPNGIDAATVEAPTAAMLRREMRARYAIADDVLALLHVGRFSKEKGQMSLMEANRRLLQRLPGHKFVWLLCGDGPTMAGVQQFVAAHDMPNVIFVGRTSEVGAFLCAADVFVMPSDFEGMPNAMMEAMAQGLPAVSTDVSGALDVARDGQEALYYRPRDIDALTQHLTRLIEDPAERARLGSNAVARMHEFSVEKSVATFEARLIEGLERSS